MTDVIADAVDTTADIIERYGWVQGQEGNEVVGFCLTGATKYAMQGQEALVIEVLDAISKDLPTRPQFAAIALDNCSCPACRYGDPAAACIAWNDAGDRTQQEVLDHLRLAAKRERS